MVRQGSFSGAADALSMARSTVSQHIRSLEEGLGVRLIERTTRKLRLTEEGELLYDRMSAALAAWQEACAAFDERRSQPAGTLRVTSPGGLVSPLVGPVASGLMRDYPEVAVELVADDRVRDLLAEQIDVAIRMAPLGDSRLIAKLLGHDQLIVVAAPQVAENLPDTLSALEACEWVGHARVASSTIKIFPHGQSEAIEIRPRYRAHGSNTASQVSLTAGGIGVTFVPGILVRDFLAHGTLVRAFPSFHGRSLPIYALYPARGHMPARTRVFLDRLVAAMSQPG